VEHITSEFNRSEALTTMDDLKMGDIFESKVKMLQVITEWSIACGVSFMHVKTNRTLYTTFCASIIEGDNVGRDVCLWRMHASVSKGSGGYFKIKSYT